MLLMMAANLVGFVIGTDGLKFFLGELFGTIAGKFVHDWSYARLTSQYTGVKFAVGAVFCMFVGAQFMFEYRWVLGFGFDLPVSDIGGFIGRRRCARAFFADAKTLFLLPSEAGGIFEMDINFDVSRMRKPSLTPPRVRAFACCLLSLQASVVPLGRAIKQD